jgi:hypothetical protein
MKPPKWISKLLEQESVAYSQIKSKKNQQTLSLLESLDLVSVEINKSRRKVVVTNQEQFSLWVARNYPVIKIDISQQKRRAKNIANKRNSKSGKTTHQIQPILLKWFDSDLTTLWSRLTKQCGVVGITSDRLAQLRPPSGWRLLTVENWESFYTLNYAESTFTIIAVYLGGHVSDVTLKALSQLTPTPSGILHFGDYDWTGLTIFQRIKTFFPRTTLYIPENLEELFRTFGGRELIEKQLPLSTSDLSNENYQSIVELIREYNAGLEQEIVTQPSESDFTNL